MGNREIKFRGKRIDTGEWVYGNLLVDDEQSESFIIIKEIICVKRNDADGPEEYDAEIKYIEVYNDSVGQYTGLKDNTKWKDLTEEERTKWTQDGNMPSEWNGKEIYEGDIVGVPFITPMGVWEDKYDPETIYEVIFEHGEFALKRPLFNQPLKAWLKKEKGEYIPNYGNRTIIKEDFIGEVIGNIYEHPDLLGGMKK
jgi:hypothetical protein